MYLNVQYSHLRTVWRRGEAVVAVVLLVYNQSDGTDIAMTLQRGCRSLEIARLMFLNAYRIVFNFIVSFLIFKPLKAFIYFGEEWIKH